MAGMTIREWVTGAHLAMPFTNIREWSGPPEEIPEWTRFVGSTEQHPPKDDFAAVCRGVWGKADPPPVAGMLSHSKADRLPF